jgi:NAD(P)H-hydrate epimerase
MRTLEQAAVDAGTPLDALMEQAGLAIAQEVWLLLGVASGRRVLVLVGPGNNGGDGLVAARHLADFDADVCVYMTSPREADRNLDLIRERGTTIFAAEQDTGFERLLEALAGAEVVIDALLGIGRSRPIDGPLAEILRRLSERLDAPQPPRVVAVDLPTGVDADTGQADPLAVTADLTVTFGVAKMGLYTLPGSEHAGRIEVVDIGLPKAATEALPVELLTTAWVRDHLPMRAKSGNKGTFGKVIVVAGSSNYIGAVRLCGEACYRAGAGLVQVAAPAHVRESVAASLPEATWLAINEEDGALASAAVATLAGATSKSDVLLIGPGLSLHGAVRSVVPELLEKLSAASRGAVVDADGLNALAEDHGWERGINARIILTPHPGEMARLLGTTIEAVQAHRLKTAIEAAAAWNQVVVLKGAHTIIAAPEGHAAISPFANPLLAVAGTGDVLAGMIAGLLAQGMGAFEAAAAGVYIHATAAEEMKEEYGDRGLLARELLPAIPRAIRTILQGRRQTVTASPRSGLDLSALAGLVGGAGEADDFGSLFGR